MSSLVCATSVLGIKNLLSAPKMHHQIGGTPKDMSLMGAQNRAQNPIASKMGGSNLVAKLPLSLSYSYLYSFLLVLSP